MAHDTLNSQGRQKIEVLQLLRGIAALMVVVFHARTYTSSLPPGDLLAWLTNPFSSGIDLFFIVSGFVMVYTTQSERSRNPTDFFIKRFCRIVPTYIVATIAYVACMRIMEHVTGYRGLYDHLSFKDVLKSLVFIPIKLNSPQEPPFFGAAALHVGWTLNYEMYFYLVFFGSLFFKRYRWIAFAGWMGLTLLVLPIVFRGQVSLDIRHFYGWRFPYLNLMTSCLIWEFITGVVIGHLWLRGYKFPDATSAWLAIGLALTLAVWAMYDGLAAKFGELGYGGCYAILICVLLAANNTLELRVPRALIWLGDISFSLYLVHPTIIENLAIPLLDFPSLRPALTGFPYVLFLAALSVCAAYPFHVLVERRLSNVLRDRLLRRVQKEPSASAEVKVLQPSD